MAALPATLEWALDTDLSPLKQAVQSAMLGPLVAIGSGGSLSTASALAYYHRLASGHISTVLTPLESVATQLSKHTAVWLLSASGNNVDIVAAAKSLVFREPRQLAALVGKLESKLGALAAAHPYMDLLTYPPPSGKDGFLATNSLFASTLLLARAYGEAAGPSGWDVSQFHNLNDAADTSSGLVDSWKARADPLWRCETTVVLHGASTALGAIDLESKFTESAVGHAQIADYRNFAHGRHHWLAKRGDRSAVLAFVGDEDQEIAARTLGALPNNVPVAVLRLEGSPAQASLLSLLAAFRLTEWAGKARSIDPGDPGVPEFGRKIYHLSPPRVRATKLPAKLTRRSAAAIERKAGLSLERLNISGDLALWQAALSAFSRQLAERSITGLVLDYDGTLVDTRRRYFPPSREVVSELVRLVQSGLVVGVATGRGKSVRHALQDVVPSELWRHVVVGYYNGAEVSTLDDDQTPQGDQSPLVALKDIADLLLSHPVLRTAAMHEVRREQLTLTTQGSLDEQRLWAITRAVVANSAVTVRVVRSSHSVDILLPGVSKTRVVDRVRELSPGGAILTIGDRGAWPGNDFELLATDLALSVDEQTPALGNCWNLGAPGQRGLATTIEYLRSIEVEPSGSGRVNVGALL